MPFLHKVFNKKSNFCSLFFYFSAFEFFFVKFLIELFFFKQNVVLLKHFFFKNAVFYIMFLTKNVNFDVFYISVIPFFSF